MGPAGRQASPDHRCHHEASIAFSVARIAQAERAQVVLTGFADVARRAGSEETAEPAPLVELDVTDDEHLARRFAD
jgi:enoyl-[acyl-carrier protein] reductase I